MRAEFETSLIAQKRENILDLRGLTSHISITASADGDDATTDAVALRFSGVLCKMPVDVARAFVAFVWFLS